ncbi:TIGR02186 family protein [Rickettsiales bacterium]|nr:TIGR02186 family protein [Rickettsiales bacterium]
MIKFKLLILLSLTFISLEISARPIISGISSSNIEIDTNFSGEEILLFGSKDIFGDIFIIVRGPKKDYMVNKKGQILGVWINKERLKFIDSNSYYATFGDHRALRDSRLFSALEMSQKDIDFNILQPKEHSVKEEFKLEFIKNFTDNNLYMENSGEIDFLDENLFKVMLKFPKNISEGVYNVEIYLMEGGNLGAFQSIPIYVDKVGFSANISKMAREQPLRYGILAVLIAICASLTVNFIVSVSSGQKD